MRKRLGSLSLMVVSASLVLAASAWSRPTSSATHDIAGARAKASRWAPRWMPGHRTDVTGYVFAWINIGSCHSYPDDYEMYVVTGDPETGEISDWADVGAFAGACGVTTAPGLDEAAWNACGCDMWDGHVQGSTNGTSTWTPDEPFCFTGCGGMQMASGRALRGAGTAFSRNVAQAHRDVVREAITSWRTSIHQSYRGVPSVDP